MVFEPEASSIQISRLDHFSVHEVSRMVIMRNGNWEKDFKTRGVSGDFCEFAAERLAWSLWVQKEKCRAR